jgi:hypothetical protein
MHLHAVETRRPCVGSRTAVLSDGVVDFRNAHGSRSSGGNLDVVSVCEKSPNMQQIEVVVDVRRCQRSPAIQDPLSADTAAMPELTEDASAAGMNRFDYTAPSIDLGGCIDARRFLERAGVVGDVEPKHVWSIRVRLEIARSWRDLVIFNLAIDSKLALLRHFDHALERRGLSYVLIFIAGRRTLARG